MVFLWTLLDNESKEKSFYIQFFYEERRLPIDRGMATEILSQYEYAPIDPSATEVIDEGHMAVISVVEIKSNNPILLEDPVRPGEVEYKLRLSLNGPDVDLSHEFIRIFQSACNLEPTNINDVKYGRVKTKYFRIVPKRAACLKFE